MILSGVMMLRHLGETEAADRVANAVNEVLVEGRKLTYDLGGKVGTSEMAAAIVEKLS